MKEKLCGLGLVGERFRGALPFSANDWFTPILLQRLRSANCLQVIYRHVNDACLRTESTMERAIGPRWLGGCRVRNRAHDLRRARIYCFSVFLLLLRAP
jgi:hypothetical protein